MHGAATTPKHPALNKLLGLLIRHTYKPVVSYCDDGYKNISLHRRNELTKIDHWPASLCKHSTLRPDRHIIQVESIQVNPFLLAHKVQVSGLRNY